MPQVLHDDKFELIGEVTLDERNRVALTKALAALSAFGVDVKRLHFTVLCNKAGQILLSPKATVPLHEAWLYQNRAALKSVLTGIEQASRGELRDLGSFAQYANDDIE
jgi:hypothetical protein